MNNNYNEHDAPDEYLADQLTSDQYAKAARQANEESENPANMNSGVRKFTYRPNTLSDDEALIREENFLQNIEQAKNSEDFDQVEEDQAKVDPSNSNQYDLEDIDFSDESEQFSSSSSNSHIKKSNKRPKRSTTSKKSGFLQNRHVKDILTGIRQIFTLLFSKRPMQAFHLNLHWGVLGILALFNVLLVAAVNSNLYAKSIKEVLNTMRIANLSGAGTIFGISFLSQLATLVLIIVLLVIMSFLLKSEKRNFKQFVQTVTLSTVPYTLVLLLAFILSFFFPLVSLIIAVSSKIHTMIYLYAGFQKGHPTRKNSPFWLFLFFIILVFTLQVFFITLMI